DRYARGAGRGGRPTIADRACQGGRCGQLRLAGGAPGRRGGRRLGRGSGPAAGAGARVPLRARRDRTGSPAVADGLPAVSVTLSFVAPPPGFDPHTAFTLAPVDGADGLFVMNADGQEDLRVYL